MSVGNLLTISFLINEQEMREIYSLKFLKNPCYFLSTMKPTDKN